MTCCDFTLSRFGLALFGFFPEACLPVGLAPPKDRMGPEENKHSHDQEQHENGNAIEDRILFRVIIVRVGNVSREPED